MDTADTQTNYQQSATTETRKSLFTYANASTGSNLLYSFASRTADKSATTLLDDRPVIGEWVSPGRESIEKSPTVCASQKRRASKRISSPKTSRELAIERMGRVLKSDRTELR